MLKMQFLRTGFFFIAETLFTETLEPIAFYSIVDFKQICYYLQPKLIVEVAAVEYRIVGIEAVLYCIVASILAEMRLRKQMKIS